MASEIHPSLPYGMKPPVASAVSDEVEETGALLSALAEQGGLIFHRILSHRGVFMVH
jgi:hypothetical protein